ncbi:MAG: cytochrome C [Ignavibacteria bacterium]|nr:MAG: cytochrome C [Ignavibacteria bacterium]
MKCPSQIRVASIGIASLIFCGFRFISVAPDSHAVPKCPRSMPAVSSLSMGLTNSHHDFSGAAWANNDMCSPCHTPHNANTTIPDSPLWAHDLSSATYSTYSSLTLNASIGQLSGTSKLCLSCHDGTVALPAFIGVTGNPSGSFINNKMEIGTNLQKHHPIGFTYNTSLAIADGELYDPALTSSGLGGTIAQDMLDNGKLGCVSCHDVHITRNTSNSCAGCHTVHAPMRTKTLSLWKSNDGSELCLTCHNK